MRPQTPRIPPLPTAQYSDAQAAVFGGKRGDPNLELNFVRTLVQHLDVYKRFIPFAAGLQLQSNLPSRDREILVLRTLALVGETYEARAHVDMARAAGLSDAEAEAAREGGAGLMTFEATLAKAAEELIKQYHLSDVTWAALAAKYTKEQMIELHYVVGNYVLMSMLTIGLGVQLDENAVAWKPNG